MKKILALLLALMMVLGLVACADSETATTEAPATETAATTTTTAKEETKEAAAPVAAAEKPAETQELDEIVTKTVYDTSEYASMTVDELYAAALQEGGKLVVYSETSSTEKSVAAFQEQYPGIEVEVTKYKNYDIAAKIPLEFDSDQVYADMVVAGDSSGEKYNEWYEKGYVVAYVPADMKDDLYADYLTYGLPITIEGDVWWYSKNMYPDGCPITSWWDPLEKDENGNYKWHIYMHDATNDTTCGMLCNLIYNADLLEQSYKDKYGTDLEYTYDADELGVEPNNAGYEWLYRYLQCNYTVITDSDEILATIDKAEEPSLGFGTSLKYGDTIEAGENVFFAIGMAPCTGFAKVKYVYISTKTDNPAAARLFAIYSLGGADGQGAGYDKYVNRNGCYGVRYSHDDSTHSDVSLLDLNILPSNIGFVYENHLDVQDFWTYYADQFAK